MPASDVLARQPDQVPDLIAALALFAPGLVGFGVITTMSRVMIALGRLKAAAVAVVVRVQLADRGIGVAG